MHPSKKNRGDQLAEDQIFIHVLHGIHVHSIAESAGNLDEAEDGGFGICGDKTRYATLQRQRQQQNPTDGTLRNFRNNISSLSQEVTYAELTLPRNKGQCL